MSRQYLPITSENREEFEHLEPGEEASYTHYCSECRVPFTAEDMEEPDEIECYCTVEEWDDEDDFEIDDMDEWE